MQIPPHCIILRISRFRVELPLRAFSFSTYGYRVNSPAKVRALSAVVCLGCLLSGVTLAALSLRDPERADLLERWSGICLVIGLCLLGVALRSSR